MLRSVIGRRSTSRHADARISRVWQEKRCDGGWGHLFHSCCSPFWRNSWRRSAYLVLSHMSCPILGSWPRSVPEYPASLMARLHQPDLLMSTVVASVESGMGVRQLPMHRLPPPLYLRFIETLSGIYFRMCRRRGRVWGRMPRLARHLRSPDFPESLEFIPVDGRCAPVSDRCKNPNFSFPKDLS